MTAREGGAVSTTARQAAQLAKARCRAAGSGLGQAAFREGCIERPPVDDGSVDVVINNGVINLSPDEQAVSVAAARALRPGGRLAIADIVGEHRLPENITCDAARRSTGSPASRSSRAFADRANAHPNGGLMRATDRPCGHRPDAGDDQGLLRLGREHMDRDHHPEMERADDRIRQPIAADAHEASP
jgi:SAM-dependent methyltransferase